MVQKQAKRSEQEWMNLIQECRASGLSDKDWCEQHGIPVSSFYNKISELAPLPLISWVSRFLKSYWNSRPIAPGISPAPSMVSLSTFPAAS